MWLKIFLFAILILSYGCAPVLTQKPKTTLIKPEDSHSKEFYINNEEGISCLAEVLSPQRTIIGFDYEKEGDTIVVKKIEKNSPAEKAGLQLGDRVTAINGKSASSFGHLESGAVAEVEVKRGGDILLLKAIPVLKKNHGGIETQILIFSMKEKLYILEEFNTGTQLNSIQFKSSYDRAKWMISNWFIGTWQMNGYCLDFVKDENIGIRLHYQYRNFVNEFQPTNEVLQVFSNKADIIAFYKGDIAVQDLLDRSMVFINWSREKITMQ